MKRHLSTLWTGLLMLTLILAGCQQPGPAIPADPVEAVKLIADKQKDITSQHLDLTLDLALNAEGLPEDDPTAFFLQNFKANATLAGDLDNAKQDFQLTGSADLGPLTSFLAPGEDQVKFELIKAGDTMYSRLADQEWSESPVEAAAGGGAEAGSAAAADLNQLNELLKKVAQAERLGDEGVDGVDSYHFKVTFDPVELLREVAQLAGRTAGIDEAQLDQASDLLKDAEISLDLWVGKADLLIRQQRFHFKIDLKNIPDAPPDLTLLAELNLLMKTSKINQVVTISAP